MPNFNTFIPSIGMNNVSYIFLWHQIHSIKKISITFTNFPPSLIGILNVMEMASGGNNQDDLEAFRGAT